MKHLSHIDGLRGLAVLGVILFHFGLPGLDGGYAGVDVFFVISGFVIAGVIIEKMTMDDFSYARFYERRARRLLPALFVMCLLSFAVAYVLLMPQDFRQFARALKSMAVFSSNFTLSRQTGYFADAAATHPLLHTWSLSVEGQFYLFFPLFLSFFFRRRVAAVWALFLASLALDAALTRIMPDKAFYMPHARAWELLAGSLLYLHTQKTKLRPGVAEVAGAAGLFLILLGYTLPGAEARWLAAPGAVLAIAGGIGQNGFAARLLSMKAPAAAGALSYGLYLYHWPVLVFSEYFLGRRLHLFEACAALGLAAAMAFISRRTIEQPARSGHALKKRGHLFLFSLLGLGVMAAAGIWGTKAEGFPQRFGGAVLQYAEGRKDTDLSWAEDCLPSDAMADLCSVGVAEKPEADFLVWGDSHAGAMRPAIDAMAKKYGARGWFVALSGCPPLVGIGRADAYDRDGDCAALGPRMLEIIERRGIRKILLIARWDVYASGWEKGAEESRRLPVISFDGKTGGPAFAPALSATLRQLKERGAEVWVMKQVPPQTRDVPTALARAAYLGSDIAALERPRGDIEERRAPVDAAFAENGLSARFIDPLPFFCASGTCRIEVDGRPLYSDASHVSVTGALWAEEMLAPFFTPPAP